jgi:hypothetical protein
MKGGGAAGVIVSSQRRQNLVGVPVGAPPTPKQFPAILSVLFQIVRIRGNLGKQSFAIVAVSPYHFAYVHTGLDDADRAMDWLERAVADRAGAAYGIKGSFIFTALHGHPRFRALLRQMKLA